MKGLQRRGNVEMKIKHRDIMIGESYCGNCKEAITQTDLIILEDNNGSYLGCPHCKDVFEGWQS